MSTPARQPVPQAPKQVTRIGPMTMQEYLRRERESEFKHEYRDGYMYPVGEMLAMSGGTIPHSKIKVNLMRELGTRLRGKKCQPFDSDLMILLTHANKGAYPDASVFCEPLEVTEEEKNAPANPSAIFEVLSSSTEAYDRGGKFEAYQQVASMRLYILISQSHPLVEVYERPEGGGSQWLYTAYARMDAVAKLPALGIEIPLVDLYENVEFPPEDPLYTAMLREQEAAYAIP
ncbi:Uma2 family endonuclease [Roseimicrobium sp. ORNL1]|uniref:Uma2 family endonuclease n=1 Tax=Roseimicrobium sp. ORNL1 TaxID=2711231 RepID=UPI0013E20400|nr:Uma2 family endonuclease [Roseimicrobium sp. ORNL1]QIF00698.1 Uma2 family endonuclease [Roseimicrobium sp. ORNL1]